jgi:hypothetical protein
MRLLVSVQFEKVLQKKRKMELAHSIEIPIPTRRELTGNGSYQSGRRGSTPQSWASSYSRSALYSHYRDRESVAEDYEDEEDEEDSVFYNTEEDLVEELLLKPIIICQKSTFAQSLFNSVNILMGIGLLSLPFAFKITGLIFGILLLWLFSLITLHTGKLLQKCLDFGDANTFGDLGEMAFGQKGRTCISAIFFFELIAASVALIILGADSIVSLFPLLNPNYVKVAIVCIVMPMTIPKSLAISSYGSLIGIIALVNLIGILLYNGFTTSSTPGSILNPSDINLMPQSFMRIPFSFGLLMAGFAGHSVFPNIYRDMAKPALYPKLLNYSYVIILLIYTLLAVVGYLMFGSGVKEEVIFRFTRLLKICL